MARNRPSTFRSGAIRAIEFVADAPGDWAFHCHKSHHTMNAMSHNVDNFIGVPSMASLAQSSASRLATWRWGRDGMADIGMMEMPLPPNTLPMMTGTGPFGPIEMGGMFTMMKVRGGFGARRLPRSGLVQASPWDGCL